MDDVKINTEVKPVIDNVLQPARSLYERMKKYESNLDIRLEGNGYVVIRLDGKSFSKFTKRHFKSTNCAFSYNFSRYMSATCRFLVDNIQDCVMGYTHSDEISLILTNIFPNRENPEKDRIADKWYNWRLEKLLSLSAAMASSYFTSLMGNKSLRASDMPLFDSRVSYFQSLTEAINNILWRYHCNIRNAKLQFAQKYCSHKELLGITADEALKTVESKIGEDIWTNTTDVIFKYGIVYVKRHYAGPGCEGIEIPESPSFKVLMCRQFKFDDFYNLLYHPKNEAHR